MLAFGCALVFATTALAFAEDAPHVITDTETDACAICHRAHVSPSEAGWEDPNSLETSSSALLVGTWDEPGDIGLCYVCHGVGALGSGTDIEADFLGVSVHKMTPETSLYGPPQKQCSSCHDSHGSERDTDGKPFAALLRSDSTTSTGLGIVFYSGDEYCASCHPDRVQSIWDGLDIWQQTVHAARIPKPASGTKIVCSVCHAEHGSDVTPLINAQITPPAITATTTVTANDRTFCLVCHDISYGTWDDATEYAKSGHASSAETAAVAAEWGTATGADRLVGECQVCHSAMGRDDGAGGVVPKLTNAAGRALCDSCHSASGVSTDTASIAFPAAASTLKELAVTYDPAELPANYSRISVYSAETTGAAPRPVLGPREFEPTSRAGDVAAGDVDGDGTAEFVVGDPGAARLEIFAEDSLAGLARSSVSIDANATWVAVGDVFLDGSGLPEVVVVSRSATSPFASSVYVYRHNGTTLTKITGPVSVGNDASGLAVGRVTRGDRDDIVVTSSSDNELRYLTESGVTPGTLTIDGPHGTRKGPRGVSIGDAWDGATTENEVVVANAGELTGTVSVFDTTGSILQSYDATANAGARAWDTVVADVLPNVSGAETIIALKHETGTSGINVYERLSGGGIGNRVSYDTGAYYNSASLAAGDVDVDGDRELIVGNAGRWARDATRREPSVQVFAANGAGTALATPPTTLWGGGVELAGRDPGLAVADVGGLGESRHPVGAMGDTHVSTETATVTRHVECADCHNVHESTSTPTFASASPASVYGPLKGAWGVQIQNLSSASITLTERRGVVYEYEVCLKCHSVWSDLGSGRDIASEVNTRNASFHSVEGVSAAAQNTAGSFVAGWSTSSMMYCVDCHSNADAAEARGPHTSALAPLMASPFWGTVASASGQLCFDCHKFSVYYTGADDVLGNTPATESMFRGVNLTQPKLHMLHVNTRGFGCETCHVSHGGDNEHMIRDDVDWIHQTNGGACFTPCHSGSTANAYSRVTTQVSPTGLNVIVGTTITGNLASLQAQDANVLQVQEVSGAPPGFNVQIDYTGVGVLPGSFKLYGRYQGNAGHTVNVQAWNWTTSAWTTISTLPSALTNGTYTYPLTNSQFLSGTGQVRVRVYHASGGSDTHNLYIDRAWLQQ